MKRITPAVVAIIALAVPAAANASVTIHTDGTGFVGKGDVQTAFGWNNQKLQDNANGVRFSASQPATQTSTQDVDQVGSQSGSRSAEQTATMAVTQSATQSVSEELTCTYTNGNGTKIFRRDGERAALRTGSRIGVREGSRRGSRDGSRDGSRAGSRAGVLNGTLNSALNGDTRNGPNQFTGFNLKGFSTQPAFTATGDVAWGSAAFGDYTFGGWSFGAAQFGDWSFGDALYGDYTFAPITAVTWGAWDAAPGEDPDDCLRSANADKITAKSDVISYGAITNGPETDGEITPGSVTDGPITGGDITDGTISYGSAVSGTPTASGPIKVFAAAPSAVPPVAPKALN